MKVSAGCTQPVHSVLRRWIGDAFFISPTSSHAKQTLLRRPRNDESSVPITHTFRSIATTRSAGALPPNPPLLLLGNIRRRCLSGTGRGLSLEENSAAARVRLQPKRGDVNVNVDVAPVDNPIDLDDLQDLNAEIAGFVGSLGDPDFDVQDNNPTAPATDRRHGYDHSHRTDHRGAPVGEYSDGPQHQQQQHQQQQHHHHHLHPHQHNQHQQQQQQQHQQQRTTGHDLFSDPDPAEARGNPLPASHLQSRRLTLADHPTSAISSRTHQTITDDVSVERQAAQRGSNWMGEIQTITGDDSVESQVEQRDSSIWIEELRAHSAASGKQPPHTGQGEGTPYAPFLGAATGDHHADSSDVASRRHGAGLERRRRLRGRKSVLVLNGAACFVGGRLASTGEPQGYVTRLMEEAAVEFNISLTVCTSNREHELLDHLCAGKFDAVIYNPAGFGSGVVSSATSQMNPVLPSNDPAHSKVDTQQQPLPEPVRGQGRALDDLRALEYGLIRARCPIVILAPRDTHLEKCASRGCRSRDGSVMEGDVSGRPLDHAGGYIAGFSGAVSYRLAMAAVADMLESERKSL